MPSYSVSVRLRRITTETAHVSVPITADLISPDPVKPDQGTLNAEKIIRAALELGKLASTKWEMAGGVVIEPHPIQ